MNQSRLFDPFTKNHGSFVPLLILMVTTSIISIGAVEFINYIALQEVKAKKEKFDKSPLKFLLREQ